MVCTAHSPSTQRTKLIANRSAATFGLLSRHKVCGSCLSTTMSYVLLRVSSNLSSQKLVLRFGAYLLTSLHGGLMWTHSEHRMNLRRENLPSWSWAGWRGNTGIELHFKNCKRTEADIQFSRGRYRVRVSNHVGPSVWAIDWYHYVLESDGEYQIKLITKGLLATEVASVDDPATNSDDKSAELTSESELLVSKSRAAIMDVLNWRLLAHPVAIDEKLAILESPLKSVIQDAPVPQLCSRILPRNQESVLMIPPIRQNALTMPPLSHIIGFYTSVAIVFIAAESEIDLECYSADDDCASDGAHKHLYKVSLPNSQENIGVVQLDPLWQGKGQLQTLVYMSRWCPNFVNSEREHGLDYDPIPNILNISLVESVEGWGEVKRRVQMLDLVSLRDWRKAAPRWELVSLA